MLRRIEYKTEISDRTYKAGDLCISFSTSLSPKRYAFVFKEGSRYDSYYEKSYDNKVETKEDELYHLQYSYINMGPLYNHTSWIDNKEKVKLEIIEVVTTNISDQSENVYKARRNNETIEITAKELFELFNPIVQPFKRSFYRKFLYFFNKPKIKEDQIYRDDKSGIYYLIYLEKN